MPEQGKIRFFAQNGNVESAGLPDHIMGKVILIHRDANPVGGRGHLPRGVDDTAVVLISLAGGQHKQAVAQVVHCFLVHILRPLIRSWPHRLPGG